MALPNTYLDTSISPQNVDFYKWYQLNLEGHSLSSRVGHTAVYLKDCGKVLLFGGASPESLYNDMWQLNIWNLKLEQVLTDVSFDSRYEHSVYVVTHDDSGDRKLWLFAGSTRTDNRNDLWEFNVNKLSWKRLIQHGNIPSPRTFHSTYAVLGGKLTVFGGGDRGSNAVQDTQVYQLNTETVTWSILPTTGATPAPRQGHVFVAVGDKLFCHGGMCGSIMYDDLFILDSTGEWSNPNISECRRPCGRAAHGAVSHNNYMYVFGGLGLEGSLNDLWKLNTVIFQWEEIITCGAIPRPRLDFAITIIELPTKFSVKCTNDNLSGDVSNIQLQNGHASANKTNSLSSSLVPFIFIHGGMNTSGDILNDMFITRLS